VSLARSGPTHFLGSIKLELAAEEQAAAAFFALAASRA